MNRKVYCLPEAATLLLLCFERRFSNKRKMLTEEEMVLHEDRIMARNGYRLSYRVERGYSNMKGN